MSDINVNVSFGTKFKRTWRESRGFRASIFIFGFIVIGCIIGAIIFVVIAKSGKSATPSNNIEPDGTGSSTVPAPQQPEEKFKPNNYTKREQFGNKRNNQQNKQTKKQNKQSYLLNYINNS